MSVSSKALIVGRGHSRLEPRWYSICGLLVRSEVLLPLPPVGPDPDAKPAWTIRYGAASDRVTKPEWNWPTVPSIHRQLTASPDGENTTFFYHGQKGADGFWFWWDTIAAVHVSSNASDVAVYLDPHADERLLGSLLAGPLAAIVLGQLGYPLLHASAVVTPRGAVAFLGRKGQGKSTMAAAFLCRGEALLTDDMLLLRAESDGIRGAPGPAVMRLWRPTIEHTLGRSSESLPVVAESMPKKLFWIDGEYSMVQLPTPVVALYVLDRYEPEAGLSHPVSTRELTGPLALAAVLAQIYGPLMSQCAVVPFLPIFARLVKQAYVRVLRYPTGFEWQDLTCQHVLQELASR